MKNIEFQIDDQIVETLKAYAGAHKYDVVQLANELIQNAISRLDISTLEEYDNDQELQFNKTQITSKIKEDEIRNHFKKDDWKINVEKNHNYGQIFEKYIGRNVFYNLILKKGFALLIVSDKKMNTISEITGNDNYENNQIFAWLCPYRKEIKCIEYVKEDMKIDVIIWPIQI